MSVLNRVVDILKNQGYIGLEDDAIESEDSAVIKKKSLLLSNAELIALSTSRILIPAPGVGYGINILSVTLSIHSVAAYVTGGKHLQIFIGDTPSSYFTQFADSTLTTGSDLVEIQNSIFSSGNDDLANVEDMPVRIGIEDDSVFTGGDDANTVLVELHYHIFAV